MEPPRSCNKVASAKPKNQNFETIFRTTVVATKLPVLGFAPKLLPVLSSRAHNSRKGLRGCRTNLHFTTLDAQFPQGVARTQIAFACHDDHDDDVDDDALLVVLPHDDDNVTDDDVEGDDVAGPDAECAKLVAVL